MSTATKTAQAKESILQPPDPALSQAWLWDLFLLGLPLVGLAPLLAVHGVQLWWRPSFQFFPMAILCLLLGMLLAEKGVCCDRVRRIFAALFASFGFAMTIYSAWIFSPSIACFAIASLWVAWGLVRLQFDSWARSICWGLLVATLVPLPMNLDSRIEAGLNGLVAASTSRVLDLFQSYHLLQSPYLAVEKRAINYFEFLDTAFSFRAVLAFVLVLIIAKRRSFLSGALSLATGILVTFVGKVVLLALAVYMVNSGVVWNEGWLWTLLNWGIAFLSIVMVSNLESMWGALLGPIKVAGDVVSIDRTRSADIYNRLVYWPGKIAKRRSRETREAAIGNESIYSSAGASPSIILMGVSVIIVLLAAPLAMAVVKQKLLVSSSSRIDLPSDRLPDSKLFPSKTFPGLLLNQYQSNAGSSALGNLSVHLWNFTGIDAEAQIVLVYPVDGWKSEWSLGVENGWSFSNQNEDSLQSPWPFVEKRLAYDSEIAAKTSLFFSSQFTLDGKPYLPSAEELTLRPETATGNRWLEPRLINFLRTPVQDKTASSFVVQMQFISISELRDEDIVNLRTIFESVRQAVLLRVGGAGDAAQAKASAL
ncbi:MAG: hypothetical protein NTW52_14005 [Planctomycetota bacterium]|nr:hypothetical protein [Planctomycetota bacterium]